MPSLHCCLRAFSSAASRGSSLAAVRGLLIVMASLAAEHRLQGLWASAVWLTGFAALCHVGSSQTRDWTYASCTGRQILTTGPPGKSTHFIFKCFCFFFSNQIRSPHVHKFTSHSLFSLPSHLVGETKLFCIVAIVDFVGCFPWQHLRRHAVIWYFCKWSRVPSFPSLENTGRRWCCLPNPSRKNRMSGVVCVVLWLAHSLWSSLLAFHLKVFIISVGFESGSVVKNLPANVGDTWAVGSTLGSGRSPGVGNGNSLQYCCLDRGAWWAIVHGVTASPLSLSSKCSLVSLHFLP